MTKGKLLFLWLTFLAFIPLVYISFEFIIFPNARYLDYIIIFSQYLFIIITFMYRADERLYYKIKKIKQWFVGSETSWSLSTRYYNINDYDKILNILSDEYKNYNCKVIKTENDFLSLHWQSKYILSFRIEQNDSNEYSLHFYTSIIDVSFRSIKKRINELSSIFDIVENKLNMVDRSNKLYEIGITYNDINPYYSFWVKTLPSEKVISFNCSISDDENSIISVDKNKIRYKTSRLQDLFNKVEKYINLKGE